MKKRNPDYDDWRIKNIISVIIGVILMVLVIAIAFGVLILIKWIFPNFKLS